ncbi:MAG: Tol-Pal system beta propeller repeat protein TolB [Deltaproteobacteria bacterium]|nr:MAG: Tol-Pal system beta propeller repeat protein TolB [Deltaproteobacteria bacterium]
MKRILLFILVSLFLLPPTVYAAEKIYIDIDTPTMRRFPIAIPEFKDLKGGGSSRQLRISRIIANDLEISGLFNILSLPDSLGNLNKTDLTAEEIDFSDWSAIGTEALVWGGYRLEGERLAVEVRLFDVIQGRQIAGRLYQGRINNLREIAHKFSNEIIREFTGKEGVLGTKLAYVSNATGRKEVYLSDLDGYNQQRITNDATIVLSPAWSPDARKIVYTSYKRRNPDLYLLDLITGRNSLLSHRPGLNISPAWSPRGDRIAFSLSQEGNAEIYSMNIDGSQLKRLTNSWGIDVSPTWSPDGGKIAFVSSRAGNPHIYVMDSEGKGARRLTYEGNYNSSPAWSPRGDRIAFCSRNGGYFQIFTMDPQGNEIQQLTFGSGNNEDPSWSPDGRYLIFSSIRDGNSELYLINANGSYSKRLTRTDYDETNPAWSPRIQLVVSEP